MHLPNPDIISLNVMCVCVCVYVEINISAPNNDGSKEMKMSETWNLPSMWLRSV